jgi:hypothetical protein
MSKSMVRRQCFRTIATIAHLPLRWATTLYTNTLDAGGRSAQ